MTKTKTKTNPFKSLLFVLIAGRKTMQQYFLSKKCIIKYETFSHTIGFDYNFVFFSAQVGNFPSLPPLLLSISNTGQKIIIKSSPIQTNCVITQRLESILRKLLMRMSKEKIVTLTSLPVEVILTNCNTTTNKQFDCRKKHLFAVEMHKMVCRLMVVQYFM